MTTTKIPKPSDIAFENDKLFLETKKLTSWMDSIVLSDGDQSYQNTIYLLEN